LAQGDRFTPVAPTSVALAAETIHAPITTPYSGFLAAHTGGFIENAADGR